MTRALIEVHGLGYSIGGKTILQDVSFSVEAGLFLAIIGPNGAGKTTLLKCLNRINRGAAGRIDLDGKPIARHTQRSLARIMSYVPQSDGRYFPFTVREFVTMGRYPHLSPFVTLADRDRRIIADAFEQTATAEFADRRLDTLSGGERQKVFIAAALAQQSPVLLLDEPTTFLDYKHQTEVLELLQRLHRRKGLTIVSVTHDVNSGAMESDSVLALKNGRVAFHGPPDELLSDGRLTDIYGARFAFVTHPRTGRPIVVPGGRES